MQRLKCMALARDFRESKETREAKRKRRAEAKKQLKADIEAGMTAQLNVETGAVD